MSNIETNVKLMLVIKFDACNLRIGFLYFSLQARKVILKYICQIVKHKTVTVKVMISHAKQIYTNLWRHTFPNPLSSLMLIINLESMLKYKRTNSYTHSKDHPKLHHEGFSCFMCNDMHSLSG